MWGRATRAGCALAAAALAVMLSACAPESAETLDAPVTAPGPVAETGSGDDGDVITDGPVDQTQDTRRSGPAVEFGGPPFGEQGDPEFESEGVWCVTVGFFWGGEAPPENVTFTVTDIVSDPEGAVTGEPAVCGSAGAEQFCLGLTMTPETPFTACSLRLRATSSFAGTAEVGFAGTLECTESLYCDTAIARVAEPGPPIVVGTG